VSDAGIHAITEIIGEALAHIKCLGHNIESDEMWKSTKPGNGVAGYRSAGVAVNLAH